MHHLLLLLQAQAVELVCRCDDVSDDAVELRLLKALLTAVTSTTLAVHGQALLLVVRACYNIFLTSRSDVNQATAKATLTQVRRRACWGDVQREVGAEQQAVHRKRLAQSKFLLPLLSPPPPLLCLAPCRCSTSCSSAWRRGRQRWWCRPSWCPTCWACRPRMHPT